VVRGRIADGAARLLSGAGLLIVPPLWWLLVLAASDGHAPTHALLDDGPAHLHYLMPFCIGWLLRVRQRLFASVARWWRAALLVAIGAYGIVAAILWLWQQGVYPPDWARLPFDVARLVQGWAAIVALVGIADRYANRDHPKRAMLAEAVFPFYIIHQTIIVVVGCYLLKADVAALPAFLILVAATGTGCWLFYAIGRSIGWLRPLIGLQRR
jgi:surface polysaccharide O-acyltransferase-like enzyme